MKTRNQSIKEYIDNKIEKFLNEGDEDKITTIVKSMKRVGLKVAPKDVTKSQSYPNTYECKYGMYITRGGLFSVSTFVDLQKLTNSHITFYVNQSQITIFFNYY